MRAPASYLLLLCAAALVGCSNSNSSTPTARFSQPPVTAFAEGTCRTVASDILSLGSSARRLGNGGEVDPAVLTELEQAQGNLRPLVEAAEPTYKPALDKLVIAAGLVRLQARVGNYQAATGDNLKKTYAAAVDVCTKGPSSSATPTP